MKKLIIALLTLTLGLGACSSDTADADLGATLTNLAEEAQTLVNESDLDAQVANAVEVVANNATTVGLAATGGEVSDADIDSLTGALDDFEVRVDEARDSLDPDIQERLDSLEEDLREAVEQLTS